jgi:hypothetical protein
MSFAPLYLLNRLFFRASDFFHHWYIDGSRVIWHKFVSAFEALDRTFAFRVTLRYFWKPLYGDYSIIGHIFGFFFRTARLLIGGAIYAALAAVMLALYTVWLFLPFLILFFAYRAYLTQAP